MSSATGDATANMPKAPSFSTSGTTNDVVDCATGSPSNFNLPEKASSSQVDPSTFRNVPEHSGFKYKTSLPLMNV